MRLSGATRRFGIATIFCCVGVASVATAQDARQVNAGQPFEVRLPFQSGTGVHWTLSAPESFQAGSQVEFPKKGAPGAAVEQKFTLTPTVSGDFLLIWKFGRPGGEEAPKEYRLNVHVN